MADKKSKAKPSAVEQFFKPTVWEDDDWGNIELPGLSDEELHSKNWNMVTRNKLLHKTANWQKAQKKMIEKRIAAGFYQDLAEKNKRNKTRKEKLRKAGLARRGCGNPAVARPCICEGVEYESMSEASRAYGITKRTMKERADDNPDAFYFKDEGPRPVELWYYITPKGRYCSSSKMVKDLGLSVWKIQGKILANEQGWDYRPETRTSWKEKNTSVWRKGKARFLER